MTQIKEMQEKAIGANLRTALTFDDILLVPRHSTVLPAQVDVSVLELPPTTARHSGERQGGWQGFDGLELRQRVGRRHGRNGAVERVPVDAPASVSGRMKSRPSA